MLPKPAIAAEMPQVRAVVIDGFTPHAFAASGSIAAARIAVPYLLYFVKRCRIIIMAMETTMQNAASACTWIPPKLIDGTPKIDRQYKILVPHEIMAPFCRM